MTEKIRALHTLAETSVGKAIFTFLSDRETNKTLGVEKLLTATRRKFSRVDVVQVCKRLDSLNLGNFVTGRRTFPSRFVFYYTPQSIGKVALNISEELIRLEPRMEPTDMNTAYTVAPGIKMSGASVPPTANFRVESNQKEMTIKLPVTATKKDRRALAEYVLNINLKKAS